ncbi:alanine racemase [Opitutaceae bacterium TAV4]|nr:alanine racemase [Opitutaceae bacterium TAV4]RRJ99247.1 alanine racemase [Opitutaceae bacterium TAV3]
MPSASSLPMRCWAEIDLAALERNLRLIRASLPAHIRYVAVVKADAYGHGLPQTAARLMHAGADLFAVASIAEAAALREIGPDWPVLSLGPVLPEEDRHIADYNVAVTVSTTDEVARFSAAARAAGRPIAVHLKIDTGMGRLGVWHEQAETIYQNLRDAPGLRLEGVFTHFSSPDEDAAFTAEQRRRFVAAIGRCRGLDPAKIFVHADNSAGLETIETAGPFNAARIGLLQFGVLPHAGSLLAQVRTEPVFSFRTRIGLVKPLPAGTDISYGRTHTLSRDSRVAILTGGYGDGIPRHASNRACVLVRGRRCPVLGRVTMDQTIIDVTDLPADTGPGEEVVLVGRQNGAEIALTEFSRWGDTIPWETLCSVTKRVARIYRTPLGF